MRSVVTIHIKQQNNFWQHMQKIAILGWGQCIDALSHHNPDLLFDLIRVTTCWLLESAIRLRHESATRLELLVVKVSINQLFWAMNCSDVDCNSQFFSLCSWIITKSIQFLEFSLKHFLIPFTFVYFLALYQDLLWYQELIFGPDVVQWLCLCTLL